MSSTKLIAFLLGLASLAGLLFFAYIAVVAPFSPVPRPVILEGLPPALLSLLMFAFSAPLAMIPGFAGFCLWHFVARKREAALEREAFVLPERESAFQARLDDLVRRLLELGGDVSGLRAEIPVWTRDLGERQRNRLLGYLAECGADTFVDSGRQSQKLESAGNEAWRTRAFSLGLLGCGGFCLFWTCFLAVIYLMLDVGDMVKEIGRILGIEVPPDMKPIDQVLASLILLPPGLTALLGGLALRWQLRREEARKQRFAAFGRRAQEIATAGCLARIESLLPEHGRIARAEAVCTLPELDGPGKGHLIAQLQARGALSKVSLSGADLRGATLPDADLSEVILTGSDLSGAHLDGSRLIRADLSGSRLFGADLRGADASEAVLRNADLRHARMHRCILRKADLRGSALAGAILWQADLAEANITREQLQGVSGSSLP